MVDNSLSGGNLPDSTNGSGNGDGYVGMQVRGPNAVVPGESFRILITGGIPRYKVSANIEATITEISTSEFEITVPSSATVDQMIIKVEDATTKSTSKLFKIIEIETSGANSYGFGSKTLFEDSNTLLISSPRHPPGPNYNHPMGRVEVYQNLGANEWSLTQVLKPDDGISWGRFGSAIESNGVDLLIGNVAINYKLQDGSILRDVGRVSYYKKINDRYVFQQFIRPPEPETRVDQRFGNQIKLNNGELFVLSRKYNDGSIFRYKKIDNLWEVVQEIKPPVHLKSLFHYGLDAGFVGDKFVVVSYGTNYWYVIDVYEKREDQWVFENRLEKINNKGVQTTSRGSLLVKDSKVILSRHNGSVVESGVQVDFKDGQVFIFEIGENGVLGLTQEIVSPLSGNLNGFGFSSQLMDDLLFVSAFDRDTASAKNVGSVIVYKKSSRSGQYEFNSEVFSPKPTEEARFGYSLSVERNSLLIGSEKSQSIYLYNNIVGFSGQTIESLSLQSFSKDEE